MRTDSELSLLRRNAELIAERDAALARANAWETDWGVERARAEKAEAQFDREHIASYDRLLETMARRNTELASAQTVIDAAWQLLYGSGLFADVRAALAEHLSRYPPKGVT